MAQGILAGVLAGGFSGGVWQEGFGGGRRFGVVIFFFWGGGLAGCFCQGGFVRVVLSRWRVCLGGGFVLLSGGGGGVWLSGAFHSRTPFTVFHFNENFQPFATLTNHYMSLAIHIVL